ncbi:MAG TPA: hypothetical protein PLS35_18305 [Nitrospira sp.]|jgi:hypothetical protein|nr:hypothetical protein [Nitrospira sp.]
MIKNWASKAGEFVSAIVSWLPQKFGTGTPVVSPGYAIAFSLEIDRDLSKTLYIKRFVNVEVEQ